MKLFGAFFGATLGFDVTLQLCRSGAGISTAADGATRALSVTLITDSGSINQVIDLPYDRPDPAEHSISLPRGDLSKANSIRVNYGDGNILCLEKLSLSNSDKSIKYDIIQDYDKNAFDTSVANPGYANPSGKKIANFSNACYKDHREASQLHSFIQSCHTSFFVDLKAEPVNECEDGSHNCNEFATCTDKQVGYGCTCKPGYLGSGMDLDPTRVGGGETAGCLPDPDAISTVDSCNDSEGIIEMTVTLRDFTGTYEGIDPETGHGVFTVDQLEPSFSEDGEFLYMSKVLGGTGCTEIVVDGVTVCSEVGETITLRCKYSLADQDLEDSYQVTGQDTEALAENTGTLGYKLTVDDNKAIGDEIKFRIDPINANLVYATIKECHVHKNGNELTIIGHGAEHCLNPAVGVQALTDYLSSQSTIQASWTAFKWSTATEDANAEDQRLSCKIGLSELMSTDVIENCTAAN